jgi:hypothetical protein
MMSGGDLDGDEFLVIWEKELVNFTKPVEPADYKSSFGISRSED